MASWRILYIKSFKILSKCFSWPYLDSTLQELSNGTKNTQIEVRMTKLWSYEVGIKTEKLLQCRDVVESAETKHLDVATLPNDVATLEVGFGWIFSPF